MRDINSIPVFIFQQFYITCRAYFPECEICNDVVVCRRAGFRFVVEIDTYNGSVTYDIYSPHRKPKYGLNSSQLIKELKKIKGNPFNKKRGTYNGFIRRAKDR